MKRVLIIGCGGAGKSTLARRLATVSGLPVVHLDRHYWNDGWVPTSDAAWQEVVRELMQGPYWIMDGNYGGTMSARIAEADTIVFLDFPRWLCLWRIIRRRVRFAGQSRPDLPPGCPERLTWEFLAYIWNYRRTRRPVVLDRLKVLAGQKRVIVLRNPREVAAFEQSMGFE